MTVLSTIPNAASLKDVRDTINSVLANLGPLPTGAWVKAPSIYRLRLTGTGSVTIDARNSLGTVTASVSTYTLTGETNRIEYPYFGSDAVAVRATLTGSATAEII